MNTKTWNRLSFAWAASTTLLMGFYPYSAAQAAQTNWISPQDGNGFYNTWINNNFNRTNMGSYVNDGVDCDSADLSTWWVIGIDTSRQSAIITIPSTIPDGSTIVSIDVQVCQSRAVDQNDGSTFQTFIRLDGSDTDSGNNITAATPFSSPTDHIDNYLLGIVKSGSSFASLEVGTVKTNSVQHQTIRTIAANIIYTIPSTTTVVCASPIYSGGTSLCTATVAPDSGNITPTGAVTWGTSDSGSFGSESCTPGTGSLACTATFTPSGVGTPSVTATYDGDSNTSASNGGDDVQVDAVPSTTTVTCTSPIRIGGTSACTATVAPDVGSITPTGAVAWGTSDSGSFESESCTPGAGSLECTVTFTPGDVGAPTVTATYDGDSDSVASNGSAAVEVLEPLPVPVFGPFGLLLTALGMGIVGGWQLRRRT